MSGKKHYNMKRYTIWSNLNLDVDDWIDGIKENLNINEIDYSNWSEYMFYQ